MLSAPHISPINETDWLLKWPTGLDITANLFLHKLATHIQAQSLKELKEVIVAYESILLQFEKYDASIQSKLEEIVSLTTGTPKIHHKVAIQIPVCYDKAMGNDLEAMSVQSTLPVSEIIHLHHSRSYHIYMLGFLPGFAYMGSVDERIALPRKTAPVPVRAGAVGIAGSQTGIYPANSPGGWNIVGYTPLQLFDATRNPACLLQPGQQVQFVPISLSDYNRLLSS